MLARNSCVWKRNPTVSGIVYIFCSFFLSVEGSSLEFYKNLLTCGSVFSAFGHCRLELSIWSAELTVQVKRWTMFSCVDVLAVATWWIRRASRASSWCRFSIQYVYVFPMCSLMFVNSCCREFGWSVGRTSVVQISRYLCLSWCFCDKPGSAGLIFYSGFLLESCTKHFTTSQLALFLHQRSLLRKIL